MTVPFAVGVILFGAVGVLLSGLGVPLLRRRVRPNLLYGLRTRATLGDETAWYEANARLGRGLVAVGAGLLALAWGLPWVPGVPGVAHVLACAAWLLVGVLVVSVGAQATARRLAERPVAAGAPAGGPAATGRDAAPGAAPDRGGR